MNTSSAVKKAGNFYLKLDFSVLGRTDLGPFAKILYSYLEFRQGANAYSWPKLATIATDLGTSKPTILRAKKELIAAGLLLVMPGRGGKGQNNRYTVKATDKPKVERVKNLSPDRVTNRSPYIKEEKLTEKNEQPVVGSAKQIKAVEGTLQRVNAKHRKAWTTETIKTFAAKWAGKWELATITATAAKWGVNANNPGLIGFYLERQPTIAQKARKQAIEQEHKQRQAADRRQDRAESVLQSRGVQAHRQRMAGLAKAFGM